MGSYKKKLFIVLLLTLLLGCFVCSSVNAVEVYNYSTDTTLSLTQYQDNLATLFLTYLSRSQNNTEKTNFLNDIKGNYALFSVGKIDGSVRIYCTIFPLPLANNTNNNINNAVQVYFDDYFYIPTTGYNYAPSDLNVSYFRRYAAKPDKTIFHNDLNNTIFYPSILVGYQSPVLINFINGIEPSSSGLNLILSAINSNTEQQEETTEEMKKLNDFMSSEDVDQDAYDMPTENPTQDITENGINNIFNKFYNKITSWSSENIRIDIPFTNKYFIIPANLTENIINGIPNNGFAEVLKRLLSLIWYYLLGVYIVKDVQKYIDGLKTGEILTKSDTNIKTEML